MNFWNNVKIRCKQKGLTQDGLSFLASIKIGTLKNQMSKNVMPDIEEAYNIAQTLECSIEYLITGNDANKTVIEKIPDDLQELINKYANK